MELGDRKWIDTRRVLTENKEITWTNQHVHMEELLDTKDGRYQPCIMEMELCEDVVVKSRKSLVRKSGAVTDWKVLGAGRFDLVPYRTAGDAEKLVIIPLIPPGRKDGAMQLEMGISVTSVPTGAETVQAIIARREAEDSSTRVCCEQALLAHAFYQCPLEFSQQDGATHLGTMRLQAHWPAIESILITAICALAPHAKKCWLAHWCTVLRQLGAERQQDALTALTRALRDRTADRILTFGFVTKALDGAWHAFISAHWSDEQCVDWMTSLLRALCDRVTDARLSGEARYATREYGAQMFTRLESVHAWMQTKCVLDVLRMRRLMDDCIDACDKQSLGEEVEEEVAVWEF